MADSEVRKYGCASGTSSIRRSGLVPISTPPSRTRKAIHALQLLHSRRYGEETLKVLNIQSLSNAGEIEQTKQRPVQSQMAELPSTEKLVKAGCRSGILPEMVKAGCSDVEFRNLLLDLVHTAWQEQKVPKEQADAMLIPIPKKGDLSSCNNWQGIAPLAVVGKVVAGVQKKSCPNPNVDLEVVTDVPT